MTASLKPRYSRIAGTGGYLPSRRLTNADLARQLAAQGDRKSTRLNSSH